MTTKLLLLLFFLTSNICFSQKLIAVQNGDIPSFYETADEAFDNALANDTLYFPGGTFSVNRTIDKTLHIIGVGHNPNSTTATGSTIFASDGEIFGQAQLVYVTNGGGSITGIAFAPLSGSSGNHSNININNNITSLSIDRVNLTDGILATTGTIQSVFLVRSIIKKIDIREKSGVLPSGLIANNIIYERQNYADNILVENNVFLANSTASSGVRIIYTNNCSVVNNIFQINHNTQVVLGSNNTSYRNNYGIAIEGVYLSHFGSNNINGSTPLNLVFANYSGVSSILEYNFDLHLVDGSSLLTTGNNGGQIGIYGGRFPWKDGSIPFNPHIVSKNISGSTDTNGNLPVIIEVEAQQN